MRCTGRRPPFAGRHYTGSVVDRFRPLNTSVLQLACLFAASRLALLLVGLASTWLLPSGSALQGGVPRWHEPAPRALEIWARWDSEWYLLIADTRLRPGFPPDPVRAADRSGIYGGVSSPLPGPDPSSGAGFWRGGRRFRHLQSRALRGPAALASSGSVRGRGSTRSRGRDVFVRCLAGLPVQPLFVRSLCRVPVPRVVHRRLSECAAGSIRHRRRARRSGGAHPPVRDPPRHSGALGVVAAAPR